MANNVRTELNGVYAYHGGKAAFIPICVNEQDSAHFTVVYRHPSFKGWKTTVVGRATMFEPHPDPDSVWADYCAWRLTHA